jgi:hypothetical protein
LCCQFFWFLQEEKLTKAVEEGDLFLARSEDRWTTRDVMIEYVQWLRAVIPDGPIPLLLDVFAAHRDKKLKKRH